MATRNASQKAPESPAETPADAPATEEAKTKRPRVQMVLTADHDLAPTIADEDDFSGRRGRGSAGLDDEIQTAFKDLVAQSFNANKPVTVKVPPEAEKETVKRLRAAAEAHGLGISIGNIRPDAQNPAVLRVPFHARAKRQYTKKA